MFTEFCLLKNIPTQSSQKPIDTFFFNLLFCFRIIGRKGTDISIEMKFLH